MRTKRDQEGTKWDQVGIKWDHVGTKWDQVGTKSKNVDFSLVFKGKTRREHPANTGGHRLRPGSATLGGTPCDSFKSLLEPFSVQLLGNFSLVLQAFLRHRVGTKSQNVDFSLVYKGKTRREKPRTSPEHRRRHGSALLAGTPCEPLKSLLEPFSVPL